MPLTEYEAKEALRAATDYLVITEGPGSLAAREGISNTIPLVMMGVIAPADLDELASIVEENGRKLRDPDVPLETHLAQLKEAVRGAFEQVKREQVKRS